MEPELLKQRARLLRTHQTDAEKLLWYHLRSRRLQGYKFRRQFIHGNYILDFVCLSKKVIIEVDGGQHSQQVGYDAKRTDYLISSGFKVLRFWNNEVLCDISAVLTVINEALNKL